MNINDLFNKWTVLILGIWLIGLVATLFLKKTEPLKIAFFATALIGFGYVVFIR